VPQVPKRGMPAMSLASETYQLRSLNRVSTLAVSAVRMNRKATLLVRDDHLPTIVLSFATCEFPARLGFS